MKKDNISKFTKGWFVGKFEPSLFKGDFEVAYQSYKKGERHKNHYHILSTEINVVTKGRIKINDEVFKKGEIFILEPYEVSKVEYLTNVELIVVRTASNPTDKYEVD